MALFSLFENGVINCFFPSLRKKKENKEFRNSLEMIGAKYNISVLPVIADFEFENLYPETNQVHKWNIFIVGKDKTYIHAQIYDLDIPEGKNLPNHKGANVLTEELNEFFEPCFDKTLEGRRLQLMVIWRKKTYLLNTYPLTNHKHNVVGAVMFLRDFELLPPLQTTYTTSKSQDPIVH